VIEVGRRVRSIVKLFEGLSFEEQKEALEDLRAAHERSRSAKRAELERQLAELDHGVPTMPVRTTATKNGNGVAREMPKRAARKTRKATSVKAKYRNGKTGETWSGRGRMARWLKAKQDAGEDIEKYLLN
jgi:DNA-binding protein H-NS